MLSNRAFDTEAEAVRATQEEIRTLESPSQHKQQYLNKIASAQEKNNVLSEEKAEEDKEHVEQVKSANWSTCISFLNVNYEIPVRRVCRKSTESKRILDNVSGIFKPGLNGIFGPTGSGKTTLLDVLAGRKNPRFLSGHILVNGQPRKRNFCATSGYVRQEDIIMGTLTVHENILFSANLRLSSTVTMQQKLDKVATIIEELGLTSCAHSYVGTQFLRGISGGEKKRTNIAMEMVISPKILFLDEPTSGLDSSTALTVMCLLQKLAQGGRTIIFSIHQPRYSIFKLIEQLLILNKGRIVYQGACASITDYFGQLGYTCEPGNNPADFMLDIVNNDESPKLQENSALSAYDASNPLAEYFEASELYKNLHSEIDEVVSKSQVRSGGGRGNPGDTGITIGYAGYQKSADEMGSSGEATPKSDALTVTQYTNSFFVQMRYLLGRGFTNLRRDPKSTAFNAASLLVFSLVVGVLFFQVDHNFSSGLQNRIGAMFFLIMNMIFSNMSLVEILINERIIFIHENSSGYYRTSAYFFARYICVVVPSVVSPMLFYVPICYWMVGFLPRWQNFLKFLLLLVLTSNCSASIVYMTSASTRHFPIATLLTVVCNIIALLFGGLLVNVSSIVVWLRWIKYLSVFQYSLSGMQITELKDQAYCSVIRNLTRCNYGNEYLSNNGVAYETDWDFWKNPVAIIGLSLGFLTIAFIQMLRINKYT